MLKEYTCSVNLFPAMVNTKKGTLYGYINSTGNFIIKPQYTSAMDFTKSGTAIVSMDDLWGLIDSSGNYVVKPIYNYINNFEDEVAVFTQNGTTGIMDEHGVIIPTNNYSFINNFSEGLAVVSINKDNETTLYGYIDKSGKEVIPISFSQAFSFNNGYALVKTPTGTYEIIDKKGIVKTMFPYKSMGNFNDNYLTFSETENDLIGYVDLDGHVIVPPKYTTASPVVDDYIIASISPNYLGKYGAVTVTNLPIYPYTYNDIQYLSDGHFALGIPRSENSLFMNNLYALGNKKGIILTNFVFKNISKYNNSIASASDLKYTFFIDLRGIRIKYLPIVEGTGTLSIKCGIVYADTDYWPMYLKTNGDIIYEPNQIIPLDDLYSVLIVKYKPNVNYLIYYPQIQGVTPLNIAIQINAKLRELSDLEKINESTVLDYDKYGNFSILFFEKHLFIPEINTYNYPFGAAHGMTTRKTPNINLKTGEFYTLDDLFKDGIYWTKYINDIISNMIKTDPQYEYVYPDGFKGIEENQTFYVDKDNLFIYFTPYDIAPYASGFVTFKIPFIEIDSLINKQGSFYQSFN